MFDVRYSYLLEQFAEASPILAEIGRLVATGDFTLGKPVAEFERRFAELIGTRHAIGVGSGTDALKLPLKALGVGHGDEVITAANTFIATVGAIAETGATPVLVDCDDSFCLNVDQVEAAITAKTKAIMPVQLTGEVVDMVRLMEIARRHSLPVVEDACQAILGEFEGKRAGMWGLASGFSLHPLKNLNVWGDGGIVVTDDDAVVLMHYTGLVEPSPAFRELERRILDEDPTLELPSLPTSVERRTVRVAPSERTRLVGREHDPALRTERRGAPVQCGEVAGDDARRRQRNDDRGQPREQHPG